MVKLSPSGLGVVFDTPGKEGGRFEVDVIQVWHMLEYWPKKKAALFVEIYLM
ncbi:hypothetical protein [Methanospirillum lacunae]|uniref:hypothetical protein n=1 Tax=Methanospirillum lacunae TaxID=668570 RepID=UPI0015E835C3|nr:hypothetical protein [Methanospirillum lacunae]